MAASRRVAWPAALTGAVFLALHALVHVANGVAGREHGHQLLSELPTVFFPAAVVLWLARPESPLERAAFILHDVFDQDWPHVAAALDRSETACRQLASRARARVRDERPRYRATPAIGSFERSAPQR
jgi:hypothetical protein